jgi:hypothetical protein
MKDSTGKAAGFTTTAADMGHLLIALAHGGGYENTRILMPETLAAMERTQSAPPPALQGVTMGFAEFRRKGWRVLVRDGKSETPAVQSHLVWVPDAKLAYFVVVRDGARSAFWRALDGALFDKLFAAGGALPPPLAALPGPAPTAAAAEEVTGLYEMRRDARWALAPLTIGSGRLRVRARANGALLLSGAENGVLMPHAGGYWQADGDGPAAAFRDGRLFLSTGDYRSLPLWKRPIPYDAAAILLVLAGAGTAFFARRRKTAKPFPGDLVLAFSGAAVLFILVSLLVWLLSPAA